MRERLEELWDLCRGVLYFMAPFLTLFFLAFVIKTCSKG